ncbi:MAG: ankyrin repeat domain-containing protein [Dehalococcoidia bacterium]|nr:ankyrin repeat domain-containing protein [Dehalococcoidia bacterium]
MANATELFAAIEAGDEEKVRKLIAAERSVVNARSEGGVSAVLFAMYRGQKEIATELVLGGAELDLFEAAATGHVERLDELLSRDGTLVASYSADGWTALHLAAFFGQERAAALLIERGAPLDAWSRNELVNQPLHAAVAGNDTETCLWLLRHRAPVNERQEGGFTPLHEAARNGNLDVVQALLECGANPAATTDAGKTAAEIADEAGHAVLASQLSR